MTPDEIAELIAQIEEQERRLVLPKFDNDDAWRLGNLVVEEDHELVVAALEAYLSA